MKAKPFLQPAVMASYKEASEAIRKALREMSTKTMQEMLVGISSGAPMTGLRGMMAHPAEPWPYGTVLRPSYKEFLPDSDLRVMALGNGTGVPIAGYAYTDHVPVPATAPEWEPAPEPDV